MTETIYTASDWPGVPGVETLGAVRRLVCDVLVIGSGAGGAVVASELAEAGLDVVMLEEGAHHTTQSFTARAGSGLRSLYRDGGSQVAIGIPPISFVEGRCVGGSTTINGGMTWRTPEHILARWRHDEALPEFTQQALEPLFERIEALLSAKGQDPGSVGRDNTLFAQGAQSLGWRVVENIRNQVHCAGSNNCVLGCPTGAKQSTLVSYVPRAVHFGARVLADCRVDRLLLRGKRIVGAQGIVVAAPGTSDGDDASKRQQLEFQVHAKRTIVACGSIQSPALLWRSGIRSPSGMIGRELSMHPNVKVIGLFDEPVHGERGVHQAFQVREFEQDGMFLAAVNLPPSVIALSLPTSGPPLRDLMARYEHMLTAGALVEDTKRGRVRFTPKGRPLATYQLSTLDITRLVRAASLLAQNLFAAGAREVLLPWGAPARVRSMDEARSVALERVPRTGLEVATVHMMGTCRMGGDPMRHVCDPLGRVYDTSGLYVADASLFPGPSAINPMETIMMLATRVAQGVLAEAHEPKRVNA